MARPRPEDDDPAIVVHVDGGQAHELQQFRYPVGAGTDVVGRSESCAVQLVDPKVSREHFDVRYHAGIRGFVLTDHGSANGTLINGHRITEPTAIDEGDVIEIGGSRLVFTRRQVEDHATAMLLFKRHGEKYRGTMRMDDDGEDAW